MNKKMNLGLGSIAAVALPISAVVSCDLFGSKEKKENKDKDGTISLVSSAKLETVTINGSNAAFDVTLPKGKTITTDKVKALFKGVGTLTVTNDDNFDGNKAGEYKFTIKDSGKGKKAKESIATLTIKIEASWDKTLPAVPIYASKANQGQFTTTKTKGIGYVAGKSGTAKTIPASPTSGATVKIDRTVHTYEAAKKDFEFYYGKTQESNNQKATENIPSKYHVAIPKEINEFNNIGNSTWDSLTSAGFDASKDKLIFSADSSTTAWVKSYVTNYAPQAVNFNKATFLSSKNAGDSIYIYDSTRIMNVYYAKIVQKPAGWNPATPTTTLYALNGNTTEYTADETKASGYVAQKDPKVKTTNDLVKAAQSSSNKQIIIDGTTYTLT